MTEVDEKVEPLRIAAESLDHRQPLLTPLHWSGRADQKLDVPDAPDVAAKAGLEVPEAVAVGVGSKAEVIWPTVAEVRKSGVETPCPLEIFGVPKAEVPQHTLSGEESE